jgi:rRNA maturation protein Nop10
MKLKKCSKCKTYTLKENCPNCGKKTKNAHYKFLNLKDAPKSTAKHFNKKRLIKNQIKTFKLKKI